MEYQSLTSSNINENIIFKEVMATHHPVSKDFKARNILHFVKKILFLIMMGGEAIYEDEDEDSDDKEVYVPDEMELKDIEHWNQIKQLSYEIALRCSDNADDPHSTVMHFLKMLCAYPWEAKLLMMLAAFSINIGELSLLQSHKGLPCKLAIIKGIRKTPLLAMAPSHIQQSISFFIKSVLHLTDIIIELAQSSSYNSSPIIPFASYWILISIQILASYFNHLRSGDSEWLNDEGANFSSLTAIIIYLFSAYCRPILEMKREEDSYNALWCAFSDENPIQPTNLDALKLIFNVKDVDKEKPLFDYMQDQTVGLRSLENKKLVLFITSDFGIDSSMVYASGYFRTTSARLWIPIVDYPSLRWDTETMNNYYRVLSTKIVEMDGVKNLEKFIAPGFGRFVKKKFAPIFQIGGGPIIVLLDHYGRIVHCIATQMMVKKGIDFALKGGPAMRNVDSIIPLFKNALKETTSSIRHLINIDEKISDFASQMDSKLDEWIRDIRSEIQNSMESIVFKAVMEEDHWKEKTWCTKLLIGKTNIPPAEEWVNANAHIFFIGGNDINWIKKFVLKVLTEVHSIPQWTINIVYVGSNNKVASLIRRDMICETFKSTEDELNFWINLQCMFLSRIKFLDDTCLDEKSDEIVKGLKLLLAYEAEEIGVVGWALLCKGNKIAIYDQGDKMLAVMNEYPKWKKSAIFKGFDQAFKDHHNEMFAGSTCTSQHHPCTLECPSNSDKVPENMKCPQCCHNMQKIVTFRCYHDYFCKEFSDVRED